MRSVLHFVSGDESEQRTTLAVVAQADGIAALTSEGEFEDDVKSLSDDGVSFKACSNTMETMDIHESDRLGNAETVPEGAVEATRLEDEGYAYMRP